MPESADWGLLEPLRSGTANSFTGDSPILVALIEVEVALTIAWADAGYAPAWAAELAPALLDTPVDREAIARGNRAGGNPVIPLVTALRAHAETLRAGAGDWVHRGATSQDILDSALMLTASRAVDSLRASLDELAESLVQLAARHHGSLQAGRTLTQHAAPITFGVKVAGWLDGVEAALATLAALEFPVQLAGSVGTGAAFVDLAGQDAAAGILRSAVAARLSLTDPGRSWQSERSPVAAVGSALTIVLGVLGRIATDILVLARTEISEVEEGAGTGSSSAMPHKRNPAGAILIRASALRAPGLVSTVFASLSSPDERPDGAWHSEWQPLRELLGLAVEASSASVDLIAELAVDTDRMLANLALTNGLIYSEQTLSLLTREVGRSEASARISAAMKAMGTDTSFLDGFPDSPVDQPTIRIAAAIVDSTIARHSARIRKGIQ